MDIKLIVSVGSKRVEQWQREELVDHSGRQHIPYTNKIEIEVKYTDTDSTDYSLLLLSAATATIKLKLFCVMMLVL